jgi:hypothetical protein
MAVEPATSRLRPCNTQPMRERGNLHGVLPDAGLVVADVSVVRPAAHTYARNTVRTAAAAHGQESS